MTKTSSDICSEKCCGYEDNHGGCCTLADRDWIIGGIEDTDEFLERLSARFGREVQYDEVFVDYEEGKEIYPELGCWTNPYNFPALRVNTEMESRPCIFYSMEVKRCTVYDIRPNTCRNYKCDYLKSLMER